MNERFERQLAFMMEADKLKNIERQTYLADGSRKENDAEHSFHLALMCVLMSEYANETIDVLRTMTMVLIHDVVEIDAGDTYAYDAVGNESKMMREMQAADRLFSMLPEDQTAYFRQLWDEFEAGKTPEAKFANALDKVQPLLLNDASGGRSWRENKVNEDQVLQRNRNTREGSEKLWSHCLSIIENHVEKGNLGSSGQQKN